MNSIRIRRPRFAQSTQGMLGLMLLIIVVTGALLGPLFAPHDPTELLGVPGEGSSSRSPLGLDYLGGDVLSRTLHGGRTVLMLGTVATLLTYMCGLAIGLTAGYTRTLVDPLLMRSVDVLLALPAMLTLLLLVAALGTSVPVLLLGVLLVQVPGISRLVRTATLEVSTRGYVEAAVARGDRAAVILVREILPNIAPTVMADLAIRFSSSIILIASMNFLGLGLQAPTADWGLMVSENRQFIGFNPWAVLVPALALATLTISVNLISDAYARSLGQHARLNVRRRAPSTPLQSPPALTGDLTAS